MKSSGRRKPGRHYLQNMKIESSPNCTKCELYEQAEHPGIPTHQHSASSPGDPVLLVIGQNPGFHEDKTNESFVGRSGKILKSSYLGGLELSDRCNIYLTNGVRCHTTNNQTPKPRHYIECCQWLIEDLQHLNQKYNRILILTLGAPATTSFHKNILSKKGVSLTKSFNFNGTTYRSEDHHISNLDEITVFSTYHPAAVLRNHNYINSVHSHMQLISDCLDGTMAIPSDPQVVATRSPKTWT